MFISNKFWVVAWMFQFLKYFYLFFEDFIQYILTIFVPLPYLPSSFIFKKYLRARISFIPCGLGGWTPLWWTGTRWRNGRRRSRVVHVCGETQNWDTTAVRNRLMWMVYAATWGGVMSTEGHLWGLCWCPWPVLPPRWPWHQITGPNPQWSWENCLPSPPQQWESWLHPLPYN